jgi:glycosyltransferase involved in cell wall biosynthesis
LVIWATLSEVTEQARGRLRPIIRKRLLRAADAVIVNGESGARYVRGFGVDTSRIFYAPQTTEIGPYLALPSSRPAESRRRLLICGRLIELKGILPFLKNLSVWSSLHPNEIVELWIVGDGPLRGDLESFPAPQNLRIRFLGDVDYSKLPAVYAQCGILAFPTLADEWGLVAVEAMAASLPILGSLYSQAVEDLVSNAVEGWTFRSDCEHEVRSAIDCALSANPLRLEEMGIRARAKISTRTPAVMAGQIASAVDYALQHRRV